MNRREFIKEGFRLEYRADASIVLWSKVEIAPGQPDWQAFDTAGEMLIWVAAGFSEIETDKLKLARNRTASTLTSIVQGEGE